MLLRIQYVIKIASAIIMIIFAYSAPVYVVLNYAKNFDTPIVVSLIASSAALITGILALLRDFIIDFINAPALKIQFIPYDNRDCHQTEFKRIINLQAGPILTRAKTHYFRLRIINTGWETAECVEVNVEEVRKCADKEYQVDKDFIPMQLFWSNWREARLELNIPSDTYRYCDFGFILEPGKTVNELPASIDGAHQFWFDSIFRPNVGKTSLSPGRYQIIISAIGKNVGKTTLEIEMEWLGGWENKIENMYASHLKFLKIR